MKQCTKCKVEKPLTDFRTRKDRKSGYRSDCKSCQYKYSKKHLKEYYQANKEKVKERSKEYYQANKERVKEYYQANKERINERKKETDKKYYQANKKRLNKRNKEYNKANKEKINQYKKEYKKNRIKTDHLFKMICNLRTRTWAAFKNKGYSKNTKTQEMLGVDWDVAKQHIERQFTKGMNWDNYGEWHIDHIIPLASAKTEQEMCNLCNYTNLQPLWAEDNLRKGNKII